MASEKPVLFLQHSLALKSNKGKRGFFVFVCICVCIQSFFAPLYMEISPCYIGAGVLIVLMCLCTHTGIQSQTRPAVSVHLSSLERSQSATPVAVRALCPPLHPSSSFSFFLLCLLLTAASSAVSTGHWPTPWSMSCLYRTVEAAITPAR